MIKNALFCSTLMDKPEAREENEGERGGGGARKESQEGMGGEGGS